MECAEEKVEFVIEISELEERERRLPVLNSDSQSMIVSELNETLMLGVGMERRGNCAEM